MVVPKHKVGLIVPANNNIIEPEFWSLSLPEVAFYSTRVMAKGDLTAQAVIRMEDSVNRAVDELVAAGVNLIVYSDMVTTFIMDPDWNERRIREIKERTGIKCISAWSALSEALAALKINRLALGTPYPVEIHQLAISYFEEKGYLITKNETFDIRAMTDVGKITSNQIFETASILNDKECDAILFLATDLGTFEVISAIEDKFDVPVLSSNQTILWSALHKLNYNSEFIDLGGLFVHQ